MKNSPTKHEARTQKIDARQRIKDARALVKTAKQARRAALKQVREQVRAARKALPAKLAHWREVNRQIMRRAIELRAEADEFTKDELAPEMWPAWEEHKHKIKATPRTTRWEEALTFFHRHPELVVEANERAIARGVDEWIEQEPGRAKPKKAKLKPPKKVRALTTRDFSGGYSIVRALDATTKKGAIGPMREAERAALLALEKGVADLRDLDALATRADFAGLDWGDLYPEWRRWRAAAAPF